jgi:hypothetical protein
MLSNDSSAGQCHSGIQQSYQVRVQNGAGALLAVSDLAGSPSLQKSTSYGGSILDWTCRWSYSFSVPVAPIYRVTLWTKGDTPVQRDEELVSEGQPGNVPTLAVADCWGLPAGAPCFAPTP